ncbi:hypothetical protein C2G38_2179333 [Gigaspora rosea]|uniref:F-box domain-containing protein n=1 Tax=Gigaspora rosea TaxID=44941 RepID=A0A397VKJ2_9GLOM|nr:hypothetical protein C2G38_2179333 [Gigaspora rosea]
MAPKILMGDMPELMEYIVKNLINEIYSLYTCTLVSRHWCKISIPILWQDPFSFIRRSPLFISNYFSSLGEYERIILKECGINEEFSKTLFDYAKFLKVLDLISLESIVEKWIDLKLVSDERFINHIINFLLKTKRAIFSRIQHLSLDIISIFDIESVTTLLRDLTENTTKIRTLNLFFHSDPESQICHALIYFIKIQERLKLFRIAGGHTEFHCIISVLECQKNSLQEVVIQDCSFSAEFNVLNNCKNLETIRITCCNTELLKILDYKISTLEVFDTPIDAQTMALILKKSRYIEFSTQLLELIGKLHKLQFLSLWCDIDNIPVEELKIRVMQFSKILALTLQYLK